jgi:cell division protein FtsB
MAERKVVGRDIALALMAVCIILAIGLVVALLVYLPANAQIESLNAQLAQNNQTIDGLNSRIAALDSQVSSLNSSNSNVAYLQNQVSVLSQQLANYNNILSFNASSVFISNQDFSMDASTNDTTWNQSNGNFGYAGYVTVDVQSSSPTTFVELSYTSLGVVYDSIVNVGTDGTASFPILPGSIKVSLGNTETSSTVTGTVSATYYF